MSLLRPLTGAIHYEGSGDPVKGVKFVTVKDGAYALVENGAEEAPAEDESMGFGFGDDDSTGFGF